MPGVALRLIVSALVVWSGLGLARAQSEDPAKFPSRTVRLIVPSSPGGRSMRSRASWPRGCARRGPSR